MLDAIISIERFTMGKTFETYVADEMLRDAVERNVERLSEASRHVPDELRQANADIPWRPIADIGNVLRHGYDRVNDQRVWQVVAHDLASLKAAVERILAELGPPEEA